MALASRLTSTIPLLSKLLISESSCTPVLLSRTYAATCGTNEKKVKVPLALFGGSGNYASALYIAAVKANSLDKVEIELVNLVDAIKKSPAFAQFTMDLSVPAETRVKAIDEISAEAKFSDVVKNFLVVLAENGRLRYVDNITKRFLELTMAHKGELKAVVTTVIPIPPQEEKELKVTLQDIIGQGKKVKLEQKIDPSILGGLVVEFGEKVFDMSIKTRARQMESISLESQMQKRIQKKVPDVLEGHTSMIRFFLDKPGVSKASPLTVCFYDPPSR